MTTDSSNRPGPSPTEVHHDRDRRKGRRYLPCLILMLLLLALALTAIILAVTVFKRRDPRTTLLSATVTGISPRVTLPALHVDLNVTLDISLSIRNPNYASFDHQAGKSLLYYRGARVGEADLAAGNIPARGTGRVRASLTVEGTTAGLIGDGEIVRDLVGDVMSGEVGFDASTRIKGKVTFLGFIKMKAVATSECHVVVGFPDLKVKDQQCNDKTKF